MKCSLWGHSLPCSCFCLYLGICGRLSPVTTFLFEVDLYGLVGRVLEGHRARVWACQVTMWCRTAATFSATCCPGCSTSSPACWSCAGKAVKDSPCVWTSASTWGIQKSFHLAHPVCYRHLRSEPAVERAWLFLFTLRKMSRLTPS